MNGQLGHWLVLAGIALVLLGLLVSTGALSWIGRLPGDIRIEREGLRIYIPIMSMLLISVAGSLLLQLVRRLF